MNDIVQVWIDDGCIACQHCTGAAPEVFSIPDRDAMVLGTTREDGVTSQNQLEHSLLNCVGREFTEEIEEAAEGCPMEIIHFRRAR